jgi:hypothetical protein
MESLAGISGKPLGLPVRQRRFAGYRTHPLPAKIMTGSIAELLLVKEPADPV